MLKACCEIIAVLDDVGEGVVLARRRAESEYLQWRKGKEEALGSEPVSGEMEEEGTTVRVVACVKRKNLTYHETMLKLRQIAIKMSFRRALCKQEFW